MRIIHYSPKLRSGGPSALAADLACALQSSDCENIVVSPPCELISRQNAAGVRHIISRSINLMTTWQEIRRLRNIIRNHKPAVVQVYSAEAAWVTSMASRRLRPSARPRIVGVLTGYPTLGAPKVGWRHCHVFTAISKHLRNVLDAPGSPLSSKPWVIPYGVNERLCYPGYTPTTAWLEQWRRNNPNAGADKMSICVPGAISPLHGLEDIVPILTGLLRSGIGAHVFIAGDTRRANEDYVAELKQKFADAQLSDHITWIGARADLRDVLCACDVTLSLTREPATWDRPVLEALTLGRPVVGYDHGVIGELLEAFLPEGRVAPGDTASIIDTLSQWNTYSPSTAPEIPFPYRLSDTAATYKKLYREIVPQAKS